MAFGKVTLTGAISTIKEGWTAFNTLIDDLLAVTSGKGASQIGVYDSAGNMDAANVEDALAEIYTDTSSTRALAEIFDEKTSTTTGLTWGYNGGKIRVDATVTTIAAGTIGLADDAVNYVEIKQDGTVTKNTTSFTSGYIPIRTVTTASGVQTVSTDSRAWFIQVTAGSTTAAGIVELATDAETLTGTATDRAITPANLAAKLVASSLAVTTGTFSRALDGASGDVAYTGLNFQPKMLILFAGMQTAASDMWSIGSAVGTGDYCLVGNWDGNAGQVAETFDSCVMLYEASGKRQAAAIKSYDADGYTLTWTRLGATAAGTGTIFYLAFE